MADTFKFELVTPERIALAASVSQVIVPGVEGEFTVLPGHAPVISVLKPGVIEATLAAEGRKVRVFVKGGFAEVAGDQLTILAQRALEVDTMDAAAISAELVVAEAELATAADDAGRLAAASAVDRLKSLQR